MTQIKQFLPYILILILAYFCFSQFRTIQGLEDSNEILTNDKLRQIKENDSLINLLETKETTLSSERTNFSNEIERLHKELDSLKNIGYDPKIDTMPPADIERLFHSTFPG